MVEVWQRQDVAVHAQTVVLFKVQIRRQAPPRVSHFLSRLVLAIPSLHVEAPTHPVKTQAVDAIITSEHA